MRYLLVIFLISKSFALFFDNDKDELIPKKVAVYDIKQDYPVITNIGKRILRGFPFVSNTPVVNFKGKFSNTFYKNQKYIFTYAKLKNVNFFRLKNNPALYNFIYVLPIWVGDFKRVSDDLFTDIVFSENLAVGEQEILKWWIAQGGILWIENGIYATRYDAFKKDGSIDDATIRKAIFTKARGLNFLNKEVDIRAYYMAEKDDLISYQPLEVDFNVNSDIAYFKDIKRLKISNYNYLSLYFTPKGIPLLKDSKNRALITFIPFGKGGIVNLIDFDFTDKKFDGELLRWKLLSFFLTKQYKKLVNSQNQGLLVDKLIENKIKSIAKTKNSDLLSKSTPLIMHFNFAYKSTKLTKKDKFLLKPIIEYLKTHPKARVKIVGYTDSIGSKHYNKMLSLKRAMSVRDELIDNGISPDRLVVEGRGEESPIASNDTEEGRAKNRRVEFILIR